jgi:hypothetical protein
LVAADAERPTPRTIATINASRINLIRGLTFGELLMVSTIKNLGWSVL